MVAAGVRGGTDVTGYGLLGHLHRMLLASGVAAHVRAADVPLLSGARELAGAGHVPGGTRRNLADLVGHVSFEPSVDATARTLLGDAQTSGGLLIAVPEARAAELVAALEGVAPARAVIGGVVEGTPGAITVE
jgi:selenide,water dikinase